MVSGELNRISRRLGFAFEQAVCGMVILDEAGRFWRVNAAMAAMLGRTQAELKRLTFLDITHPEDIAMGKQYLADAQSGALNSRASTTASRSSKRGSGECAPSPAVQPASC